MYIIYIEIWIYMYKDLELKFFSFLSFPSMVDFWGVYCKSIAYKSMIIFKEIYMVCIFKT